MEKKNPKVKEAAKQFHQMLKDLGVHAPVIIYSYGHLDDEDAVEYGCYGGVNEVIGTCERVKHLILENEKFN